MISEVEKLGFVTPVTIFMGLEILTTFPENASSHMAVSAYLDIAAAIKKSDLDPIMLSALDHEIADVVCLAVARFIDHTCKEARKEGLTLAFESFSFTHELYSKLGNSFHQLFVRDFIAVPARPPGYKSTDVARPARVRTSRYPRRRRTNSEPASESRYMTGASVQLLE